LPSGTTVLACGLSALADLSLIDRLRAPPAPA